MMKFEILGGKSEADSLHLNLKGICGPVIEKGQGVGLSALEMESRRPAFVSSQDDPALG